MGWQSNKVITNGRDPQGFPTQVSYHKYYWSELQSGLGTYNWSRLDDDIARVRGRGQRLAIRIMVIDPQVGGPSWLRAAGAAGQEIRYSDGSTTGALIWSPSLTSTLFQREHFNFLAALGARYDNHPDIDSIDIGTVGLWGEWHFGGVTPSVAMPSQATLNLIIDKYFEAFPKKPKVAQLEHAASLKYAVSKGAGFRGDCLGNMNNQMIRLYPNNIASASAENAWRKGPINFETCWNIPYWISKGWDVNYIFKWALDHHMSAIYAKDGSVPSAAIGPVNEMLKRIGYRYVLHELRHPAQARPGETVTLSMEWENAGVAINYGNHVLAVQLRGSSGNVIFTRATPNQVRAWLPGELEIEQTLSLPSTLAPGTYTIALGVVDPATLKPVVQLANAGRDSSGWYPWSTITVR